eukprot:scaffold764_cov248-Pinguiococcus_pyrenoidosus.AAC.37
MIIYVTGFCKLKVYDWEAKEILQGNGCDSEQRRLTTLPSPASFGALQLPLRPPHRRSTAYSKQSAWTQSARLRARESDSKHAVFGRGSPVDFEPQRESPVLWLIFAPAMLLGA